MKSFKKRASYTKKISSLSSSRYRIYVRKTGKHLYITLFDTIELSDVFSVSTVQLKKSKMNCVNSTFSSDISEVFAAKYLCHTTQVAFFDRRKYKYHGNIKLIAEGLRKKNVIA